MRNLELENRPPVPRAGLAGSPFSTTDSNSGRLLGREQTGAVSAREIQMSWQPAA
jgi:hypothetical protein